MSSSKLDLLQGTLALQTFAVLGPLHGYGIARRIEQLSGNEVLLNQGTIYASLVRLQRRGWIAAKRWTPAIKNAARPSSLRAASRSRASRWAGSSELASWM